MSSLKKKSQSKSIQLNKNNLKFNKSKNKVLNNQKNYSNRTKKTLKVYKINWKARKKKKSNKKLLNLQTSIKTRFKIMNSNYTSSKYNSSIL